MVDEQAKHRLVRHSLDIVLQRCNNSHDNSIFDIKRLTYPRLVAILYINIEVETMTFEEAKKSKTFWDDYYDNREERMAWRDVELTAEQFFEVWIRKDESCDTLKKHFT